MKKVLLVVLIIALSILSVVAYADMSAPTVITYEAYVSNPNGAEYSTTDGKPLGTLPFKSKIICYDGYPDDVVYFYNYDEDYKAGESKSISKSDITVNDLSKYELGEKENVRVFGNASIYGMPTDIVGKEGHIVGTIPDETDIEVQRYKGGLYGDEWSRWYYTSYNGINGWIDIKDFAFKKNTDAVLCHNLLSQNGNVVPMYTPIGNYYQYGGYKYTDAIMYYNGEKVELLTESDFAEPVEEKYIDNYTYTALFDGMVLYEQANGNSKVVVSDIPVGTKLVPEYLVWSHGPLSYIGTTYNGVRGWLTIGGYLEQYRNSEEANKTFERNAKIIEEDGSKNDYYSTDNYPTNVEELKAIILRENVKNAEYEGEVIETDVTYLKEDEPQNEVLNNANDVNVENEALDNTNNDNVEEESFNPIMPEEHPTTSITENVWFIVSISLMIILVVLVIILLINRKKK